MKKLPIKIFQITLILNLLFFLVLPRGPANAIIGDIIKGGTSFTGCLIAGKASPFLSEKINAGIKKLGGLVNKIPKIGKILGGAGGTGSNGAGGTGSNKVPVDDQDLQDLYKTKEYSQDIETRCAAIEILNHLNINIIGLARTSGRNGGPAYVRNWRNFQTDSQYRGEGIFRAMLSNTKLCDYFGSDIKNLFGATKKTSLPKNTRTGNIDPYALRANCTMPSNFNLQNYQNDFAGNGGWNAWSRMLEPQNNYYGSLFGSLDEAAKQRTLEESADLNQVIANKGFTGKSGKDVNDSCRTKDAAGRCLEYKDIQTPGDTIAESVAASIKSELDVVVSADEVNELLSTAVFVLLNRLNNLSDPNEGDYLSPNVDIFDPNDFPIPPPEPEEPPLPLPGGDGHCADPGNTTASYASGLSNAENSVISSNPNLADSLNDIPNSEAFIGLVVSQLRTMGFQASGNVLSGNGVLHTENLIAVWQSGDSVIERYEAVNHAGDGDLSIRNAAQVEYSGDIPMDCAN